MAKIIKTEHGLYIKINNVDYDVHLKDNYIENNLLYPVNEKHLESICKAIQEYLDN